MGQDEKQVISYDREAAVAYARRWAFGRNPAYFNFDFLGGDCTNFASQCLFSGVKIMNYTPDVGWFYRSLDSRAAAWTGVEYFWKFLSSNAQENGVGDGAGPFAKEVSLQELEIGDFVQFGRETNDFYHTPIVVGFSGRTPLLAAHSYDVYGKPLTAYSFEKLRCIHILGARI